VLVMSGKDYRLTCSRAKYVKKASTLTIYGMYDLPPRTGLVSLKEARREARWEAQRAVNNDEVLILAEVTTSSGQRRNLREYTVFADPAQNLYNCLPLVSKQPPPPAQPAQLIAPASAKTPVEEHFDRIDFWLKLASMAVATAGALFLGYIVVWHLYRLISGWSSS